MSMDTENQTKHILITGGAGFIGANLVAHLLAATDARITIFDNLSHPGAELNLMWLRSQAHATRLRFLRGDVRSAVRIRDAARDVDEIYHLASRCEGTSESRENFDTNVTGTLNVLEAARGSSRRPIVFYISTSKVYNAISSDALQQQGNRLQPVDPDFQGISERAQANFALPTVCSRATADHHVTDYARFYDVPTLVLRADTVAGPRQFEKAGRGWVSHLVYSVQAGRPVTVYGSGLQVREVLHVSDVVSALMAARDFRAVTTGNVYNIGGGPAHTVSVNEMIELIERVCHRQGQVHHAPARPEDPLFFMSNSSRFRTVTGWFPRRSLEQTVRDIAAFWHAQQSRIHLTSRPMRAVPQHRHAA
ncbi:NAD-dependent epimerase/dehydratase family protein [Occallatibacter riparius]|uniref:NAD-dependent epimerase/dehydratase family protein n=1 Tax=Occallatibacter riparius TaxID=1002689 RepID=A0A9J7BMQ6_9BACT|nr:NAD-dependent epimerase/dehydratase family protein [Occallatibacter riparius]UWZ82198.1 NAD-dependent epimerase/dehydratase family protein [Occallatibacter riparius]